MKLLLATLLFAAAGFSQCFSTSLVTACVGTVEHKAANVPGAGPAHYAGSVSVATTDTLATNLVVVLMFQLADDSMFALRRSVAASSFYNEPVLLQFSIGPVAPVKLLSLYVVRQHSEPDDTMLVWSR
jgi:hypothetical protein